MSSSLSKAAEAARNKTTEVNFPLLACSIKVPKNQSIVDHGSLINAGDGILKTHFRKRSSAS